METPNVLSGCSVPVLAFQNANLLAVLWPHLCGTGWLLVGCHMQKRPEFGFTLSWHRRGRSVYPAVLPVAGIVSVPTSIRGLAKWCSFFPRAVGGMQTVAM